MNGVTLGDRLARRRREGGLTQAELARRMRTSQAAIARMESGRSIPSLPVLERFAEATGRPFELVLGRRERPPSRAELRRRVRRALGEYRFNPWERDPTPAEAESLIADGLTRERFERAEAPRGRRG